MEELLPKVDESQDVSPKGGWWPHPIRWLFRESHTAREYEHVMLAVLVTVGMLGVALIVTANTLWGHNDLVQAFGIALLGSGTVAAPIESAGLRILTKGVREQAEEFKSAGFDSILAQKIPREFSNYVTEHLLGKPIIEKLKLHIDLNEQADVLWVTFRRDYVVQNSPEVHTYEIHHSDDKRIPDSPPPLYPLISFVTEDDAGCEIGRFNLRNATIGQYAGPPNALEMQVVISEDERQVTLKSWAKIPSKGRLHVIVESKLPAPDAWVEPFTAAGPAREMTIEIKHPDFLRLTILPMFHGHRSSKCFQSQQGPRGGWWRLSTAIFPGQGMQVRWVPKLSQAIDRFVPTTS